MNAKEAVRRSIEAWLEKIPASERDVPYFIVDTPDGTKAISPQEAIDELSSDEVTFIAAQLITPMRLETKAATLSGEDKEYDLILEQVKKRYEMFGNKGKFGTVNGFSFTMSDVIKEMEQNTERGMQFRWMFTKLHSNLIGRLG
jgi:hypothetical protein